MKSTQAWGWLTAGVLALGLNGFYHDGGAQCIHRTVDHLVGGIAARSEAVMALATGRADWFAAKTEQLTARNETASCRLATAMARWQTRTARTGARREGGMAQFEAMSAREEAAFARLEAERARIEALAQARLDRSENLAEVETMACPRVRVNIPRVKLALSVVHVDPF